VAAGESRIGVPRADSAEAVDSVWWSKATPPSGADLKRPVTRGKAPAASVLYAIAFTIAPPVLCSALSMSSVKSRQCVVVAASLPHQLSHLSATVLQCLRHAVWGGGSGGLAAMSGPLRALGHTSRDVTRGLRHIMCPAQLCRGGLLLDGASRRTVARGLGGAPTGQEPRICRRHRGANQQIVDGPRGGGREARGVGPAERACG
jgi:hypothetical protein